MGVQFFDVDGPVVQREGLQGPPFPGEQIPSAFEHLQAIGFQRSGRRPGVTVFPVLQQDLLAVVHGIKNLTHPFRKDVRFLFVKDASEQAIVSVDGVAQGKHGHQRPLHPADTGGFIVQDTILPVFPGKFDVDVEYAPDLLEVILECLERKRFPFRIQVLGILPGFVDVIKGNPVEIVQQVDEPDIAFEVEVSHYCEYFRSGFGQQAYALRSKARFSVWYCSFSSNKI